MIDFPILSSLIILPLLGAILLLFISGEHDLVAKNSRAVSLWVTLSHFVLTIVLWFGFDFSEPDYQYQELLALLPAYNISFHLGIDGVSLLFVILSSFLTLVCVIISWNSITYRVKEFLIAFLLLESLIMGVFSSLNIVLFYVFFESLLIPMFLIIGIWGGKNRIYASYKFFLYTLAGSVLFLIAILVIAAISGTTSIPELSVVYIDTNLQKILWLAFFASFAVKVPMWPFHTWLPDAHVEAPTAGSVILAGVLLKVGGYAFYRLSLPILPDASQYFAPMMMILGIIAIIYTSLVALVQEDIKKLIAYSSVAHMGFVVIGLFTLNEQGMQGAIMQMISHGLISSALFISVGVIYDRRKSRLIEDFGGLVNIMPKYSLLFMIFTLSSIGLPGTSGFIGEFLILLGAYKFSSYVAVGAVFGLVLGAAYMLWLYKRVIFGNLEKSEITNLKDLNFKESITLTSLGIGAIWFGIFPGLILNTMQISVEQVIDQVLIIAR